jgi:hypothetical protein
MRAKGPTGKGYYREYFGVPVWFTRQFKGAGNGSLLNAAGCMHYLGFGMDGKKQDWYRGVFLNDFELSDPYWKRQILKADFIIHF